MSLMILAEILVLGVRLIGGEEAVAKLPVYILEITSDSMYPVLREGDCVVSVYTEFDTLKEGDLITYYSNGTLVTHEIITRNENGTVTTKGTMNSYADGEISEEYYVGKVVCRLPYLQNILDMIETPPQKLMVIAMVLIMCFGYPAGMALLDMKGNSSRGNKQSEREEFEGTTEK